MVWERESGLRASFLKAFRAITTNISNYPELYPVHRDGIRRAFLGGFPYIVFYTVEHDVVLVVSVFHAFRDPATFPPSA